ncbi:hypothetical protein LY76DRAFT_290910 [Colletotrichum caudatum]|nr:hypothetical protein LY76DRAFT_290910 [Colletotrichum caudatum]
MTRCWTDYMLSHGTGRALASLCTILIFLSSSLFRHIFVHELATCRSHQLSVVCRHMDPVLDLKTGQNQRWALLTECGPLQGSALPMLFIPSSREGESSKHITHTHTHTHTRTCAAHGLYCRIGRDRKCVSSAGNLAAAAVVVGGSQRNPAHGRRGHLLARFVRLCLFSPS